MKPEKEFDLNEMLSNHYCITEFEKEYGRGYKFTQKELDADYDEKGEEYLPLWLQFKMFIWYIFRGGKEYTNQMVAFYRGWKAHGRVTEEWRKRWYG